jgi:hypothetical protein
MSDADLFFFGGGGGEETTPILSSSAVVDVRNNNANANANANDDDDASPKLLKTTGELAAATGHVARREVGAVQVEST